MVVFRGSSVSDQPGGPGGRPRRGGGGGADAVVREAKFFNSGPYIPVDQIPAEIKRFFLKTKVE